MAQLRSLATVSGFTAISRVLGFLRDMLIAKFVGANLTTDAFFTAFRFPNMFRRIFGEGAFNAAFVPLFAKKLENDGKRSAVEFGSHTFSMLALVLGLASLIAIPCMGWIMSLVAPGFKAKLDTGWVSSGQSQIVSAEHAIPISGAKSVYLVYESKGEIAPELSFPKANLISMPGERDIFQKIKRLFKPATTVGESVPLWNYRSAKQVTLTEATDGGSGFRLLDKSVVEFPLPKKHKFEKLELEAIAAPALGGEPVRFQVYRTNPKTFPLTVTLGRITFIYLLCMALAAHLSGVLNTVRIFGMPAAAPIMLNAIFIIGLVFFVPMMLDYRGHVLAWCVFIAGFIQ